MKPETLIFDKVRKIIPDKSEETIFFVGITNTSREVYFYSFIEGKAIQCYTLAEQYELDENELSEVFLEIVSIIKESKLYTPDKYNVGTIIFDKSGIKLNMEYYDMDVSEYKNQKQWKESNLSKKGNAIQETIYLNSVPEMVETIREEMATPIEDCIPEEDVKW